LQEKSHRLITLSRGMGNFEICDNKMGDSIALKRKLNLRLHTYLRLLYIYTGRQKYFDKTKVQYTHNLNLLLVNFGINGKEI